MHQLCQKRFKVIKYPYIKAEIIAPSEYIGVIMKICLNRRAQYNSTNYLTFSALSIPVDVNYYLPIDFSGQSNITKFKIAVNFHIQRTLADGVSENWFGIDDGSYGYLHMGILFQFYQSFFD